MEAPIEANPGRLKPLTENGAFVLFAYILAFGIWTAASGNDFISSSWKSVRHTRRRGQMHVVLVFVPMIYMSVYIASQYQNRDFQEMGAALLALAFAVLHLVRTIVGLWELHIFKQWTIAAMKSMESLGYETGVQIEESDSGSANEYENASSTSGETDQIDLNDPIFHFDSTYRRDADVSDSCSESLGTERSGQGSIESNSVSKSREEDFLGNLSEENSEGNESGRVRVPVVRLGIAMTRKLLRRLKSAFESDAHQERIEMQADEIEVNETVIDNRLSDVHTTCSMQFLSTDEQKFLRYEKHRSKRWCYIIWFWARSMLRMLRILFSLTFRDTPSLPNAEKGPRLLPRHPEIVWIRWATTLVAQTDWTECLDDVFIPSDPNPDADYGDHRNHFAEKILMSAALHSDRTADKSSAYGPR